jgi:hypothetical protein
LPVRESMCVQKCSVIAMPPCLRSNGSRREPGQRRTRDRVRDRATLHARDARARAPAFRGRCITVRSHTLMGDRGATSPIRREPFGAELPAAGVHCYAFLARDGKVWIELPAGQCALERIRPD